MPLLIFFLCKFSSLCPLCPKSSVTITLAKGISILVCVQLQCWMPVQLPCKTCEEKSVCNGQMLVRNSSILCLHCTVRKKKRFDTKLEMTFQQGLSQVFLIHRKSCLPGNLQKLTDFAALLGAEGLLLTIEMLYPFQTVKGDLGPLVIPMLLNIFFVFPCRVSS